MKKMLFAILLVSCSHLQKPRPKSGEGLTQKQAILRKKQVGAIRYDLKVKLNKDQIGFSGEAKIVFEWIPNQKNLLVDLRGAEISHIVVNKSPLKTWAYDNYHLTFDHRLFEKGLNSIEIKYKRPYSSDGKGLHYFEDVSDHKKYLYSQFETYDANKFFPCFDQPDLKATYAMEVVAPKSWEVITSVRETSKKKINQDERLWVFPRSQKFSTYLLSLHAGPFKVWESKASHIPLRLFARQSLAKYVNPKMWFDTTRKGFDFFNGYFGIEYPYIKYDQLIVPEFNAGAMENVAAVTFSERYISKGTPTRKERYKMASVLYHEMAHMWFGNLVTMKWWDDLWLNESFATFMANIGLSSNKDFSDLVWPAFYGRKKWGYSDDEKPSTHPIYTPVTKTQVATANFDGITYAKGGAWLKQMYFMLGDEKFQKGLGLYFKKYANGNTVLNDFITELENGNGKAFDQNFVSSWAKRSGTNSVLPAFTCANNRLLSLGLGQFRDPYSKIYRQHKLKIALLKKVKGRVVVDSEITTFLPAQEKFEVVLKKNYSCPDGVYVNYEDFAFIKTLVDDRSFLFLKENISFIDDVFLKRMILGSLYKMVDDKKLSAMALAELLFADLKQAKNSLKEVEDILAILIPRWALSSSVLTYLHFGKDQTFYGNFKQKLAEFSWQELNRQVVNSDLYQRWFSTFLAVGDDALSRKRLKRLLDEKKRYKIDRKKRWNIIYKLASFSNEKGIEKIIANESSEDSSDYGKKAALRAKAGVNSILAKEKWLKIIKENKQKYSASTIRGLIFGLFPGGQDLYRKKFANEILADLKENKIHHRELAYFVYMLPFCDGEVAEKLKSIKKGGGANRHPKVHKSMVSFLFSSNRCVEISQLPF